MKLYIVMDTKGDGRLVGAWDTKKAANKLIKKFPAYYKMHIAELNTINKNVLSWTDNEEQKEFLTELVRDKKKNKN